LRNDPAVGRLVVDDNGIAVVVGLATAAKPGPQRLGRNRTVYGSLRGLVENGQTAVDDLNVLRCADRTDGVGGRTIDRERAAGTAEAVADAVDAAYWRWRREFGRFGIVDCAVGIVERALRQGNHSLEVHSLTIAARWHRRIAQRWQYVVMILRRNDRVRGRCLIGGRRGLPELDFFGVFGANERRVCKHGAQQRAQERERTERCATTNNHGKTPRSE